MRVFHRASQSGAGFSSFARCWPGSSGPWRGTRLAPRGAGCADDDFSFRWERMCQRLVSGTLRGHKQHGRGVAPWLAAPRPLRAGACARAPPTAAQHAPVYPCAPLVTRTSSTHARMRVRRTASVPPHFMPSRASSAFSVSRPQLSSAEVSAAASANGDSGAPSSSPAPSAFPAASSCAALAPAAAAGSATEAGARMPAKEDSRAASSASSSRVEASAWRARCQEACSSTDGAVCARAWSCVSSRHAAMPCARACRRSSSSSSAASDMRACACAP